MMKRSRSHSARLRTLIATVIMSVMLGTGVAYAGGTTPTPGTAAAGNCGWEGYVNAVAHRESSGDPQRRNDIGYTGLFQFGEAALKQIGWYCSTPVASRAYQGFRGAWCQKAKDNGVHSIEEFMNKPEAQKKAFTEWMQYMYNATKKCHNKIGQQAPNGKCSVTLSGVLGGGHLGGQGGVCQYLNGGANNSDGRTRVGDYVCCFKGFSICDTVAPGDSSCNNVGSPDGKCGDDEQKNCKGGAGSGNTGAGREAPEYENGPTVSGTDLPSGPDVHHLTALSETLKSIWVASLQIMTSTLTTVMMDQVKAIGAMYDAKHQMEVQRLIQQKTAEAHRDYHPSEQMCEIGTMVRNLGSTEKHMQLSHLAMARRILKRELASGHASTETGEHSDLKSRMKHIREVYCNVEDNGNEADYICNNKDSDKERTNRDVDYTTTLDNPLSLDIDIDDGKLSKDEENLFALVNNLFMHRPFPPIPESYTTLKRYTEPMQNMRSIIAMRSIARNSISAIIAQKTQGPEHTGNATPYMYSLMQEFGLDQTEMEKLLGKRPSYYAQMDILTKKIYQNPSFIVNLYDKPANITRIRTAMQAIKTMQDRDIHEAMMRREMLLSMILEIRIRQRQDEITTEIRNNLYRTTPGPQ